MYVLVEHKNERDSVDDVHGLVLWVFHSNWTDGELALALRQCWRVENLANAVVTSRLSQPQPVKSKR